MNFERVLSDIENMIGLKLKSIRPGSDIRLEAVNREQHRIELADSAGRRRTRPLGELETIWNELCAKPAVHVDEVLSGSGSSRNQPETILANLPYIEWLRFDNKKHIALVETPSHDYGTLRQMDPIRAEGVRAQILQEQQENCRTIVVVVCDDVGRATQEMDRTTGVRCSSVGPGIYAHDHNHDRVLLIARSAISGRIEPGTYLVKESKFIPNDSVRFQVGKEWFSVAVRGELNLLIRGKST